MDTRTPTRILLQDMDEDTFRNMDSNYRLRLIMQAEKEEIEQLEKEIERDQRIAALTPKYSGETNGSFKFYLPLIAGVFFTVWYFFFV